MVEVRGPMAAAIWWEGKFTPLRAGKVSPNLHLVDKKRKMWPNLKNGLFNQRKSQNHIKNIYAFTHG